MAEHQEAIKAIEARKQISFEKQQRRQRKYYIKNHPIINDTTLSNKYDDEIFKEIEQDQAIAEYNKALKKGKKGKKGKKDKTTTDTATAPKQRKKRRAHVPNIKEDTPTEEPITTPIPTTTPIPKPTEEPTTPQEDAQIQEQPKRHRAQRTQKTRTPLTEEEQHELHDTDEPEGGNYGDYLNLRQKVFKHLIDKRNNGTTQKKHPKSNKYIDSLNLVAQQRQLRNYNLGSKQTRENMLNSGFNPNKIETDLTKEIEEAVLHEQTRQDTLSDVSIIERQFNAYIRLLRKLKAHEIEKAIIPDIFKERAGNIKTPLHLLYVYNSFDNQ